MSEKENVAVIEDFSDLGKPYYFLFNGCTYKVPAITSKTAKTVFKSSRELSQKALEKEKLIKEHEDNGTDIPSELLEEVSGVFDLQIDFILKTGIKKKNEDGTYVLVKREEIDEDWPTQVVSRVFKKINTIISGADVEGDQEKKS